MKARGSIAMAATVAAALAGCDFLSLDAQAPNACVTVNGVYVPGVQELISSGLTNVTARQTFDVPLDSLPLSSDSTVKLVSFRLESQGSQTLDFVETAQLSTVTGSTRTVVATYARPASGTVGTVIESAPDPAPDVTGAIENDVLHLEADLTGTVPAQGFTANAAICFDVSTTVSAQ